MSDVRYRTRIRAEPSDIEAAQRLRYQAFVVGRGIAPRSDGRDTDPFDAICQQVMVEEVATNRLVATMRILPLGSGAEIARSYAAQHYELNGLADYPKPMVEVGRFCLAPDVRDPDVLRAAWGALAGYVEAEGVEMMFGCSSFHGTDAKAYSDAFAMLKEGHLAPKRWLPRIKAPNVFRFAQRLRRKADPMQALRTMPPLLRSYLSLGGWVSDHAVVDRDLNTLHVFTGLEVCAIPPGRAKALRAVAS